VASPLAGAVASLVAAAVLAWRARAVAGLLAAGLSAGGVAAAATGRATAPASLAFAAAFAVVSLGATAAGTTAGRLLHDEPRAYFQTMTPSRSFARTAWVLPAPLAFHVAEEARPSRRGRAATHGPDTHSATSCASTPPGSR
jgi:hypothetical protein